MSNKIDIDKLIKGMNEKLRWDISFLELLVSPLEKDCLAMSEIFAIFSVMPYETDTFKSIKEDCIEAIEKVLNDYLKEADK